MNIQNTTTETQNKTTGVSQKIALGIDISKAKYDVALWHEGKARNKVFDYTPEGYQALQAWLVKYQVDAQGLHACMEATSDYYERLAEWLLADGFTVSVVNPFAIKSYGAAMMSRQKTDRADATLIARYCAEQRPLAWCPPSAAIKQLRQLLSRLEALQGMRVAELNRREHSAGEALASVKRMIGQLDDEISRLDTQIKQHIDQHPDLSTKRDLLESIPGVGTRLSNTFLAWLDTNRFADPKQAVAFIGVCPQHRTSGSSLNKRTKMSKVGHGRLRRMLYMPALSAWQHNKAANALAQRLKASGKNGKAIVGAIMRKLVHWMYAVLKSGKTFDVKLALAK